MRPRLLRPDNVTPPTRTPWGGRKILDIKRGLALGPVADLPCVGESWEISVSPEFPSRFADDDSTLTSAIRSAPINWLGEQTARRFADQTPLLVKLLDAADNLSVQVHPRADDPTLSPDQSGKPESWYILAARPGSGLYLGFRDGVTREHVASCVRHAGQLEQLMNFVTVSPGDAFSIDAGTVHAVGAGVTLVEPQFVSPGRCGTTYRFWDWNRLYDEHGRRSPMGRPRRLDIERSLAVTRWNAARGVDAVNECRAIAVDIEVGPICRTQILTWPYFTVERWSGRGALRVNSLDTMLALVCINGAADIRTDTGSLLIIRGQSAVIPADAGPLEMVSTRHPTDGDCDVEILVTRCTRQK